MNYALIAQGSDSSSIVIGGLGVALVIALLIFVYNFIIVGNPSELIVIAGRQSSDGHGYRTRTAFAAANVFNSNTVQVGAQKGDAACFTPGHVNGLGSSVSGSSRLSTFDGSLNYATTIPAPSWWQ